MNVRAHRVGAVLWIAALLTAHTGRAQDAEERPALDPKQLVKLAETVEKEVEQLRGWKFKRPVKKGVYEQAQLREFMEKAIKKEYGAGGIERQQTFLRMVGLIPPDCDLKKTLFDVLLNQVGGFYDPESDAFYMMKIEGANFGPLVNRMLIAHELTHALDDQYADLDKLLYAGKRSEDRMFALSALVEGSATVLMMRYATKAQRSGKYDANELGAVAESEMERSRPFLESPPYFTTLVANYLCGMFFLLDGDLTALREVEGVGVGKKLLAATKDPPQSSEQILHPDKYWDPKQRDNPVLVNDKNVAKLLAREGFTVLHKDTVGELLCALLTSAANRQLNLMLSGLPSYWTNEAAAGWGGDRFYLLAPNDQEGKPAKQRKGVWVTVWDTGDDRDEFVEDYGYHRPDLQRSRFEIGERVAVYVYGFDEDAVATLRARLTPQILALSKDGKRWSAKRR